MNDLGATKYQERTEKENLLKCHPVALKSGYTLKQADLCNDGSLNCPSCPFKKEQT